MENLLGHIDKTSVFNLAQKMTKNILLNKAGNNKSLNENKRNEKANLIYSNFTPNKIRSKSVNAMISNIQKQKTEKKENKNSEKEINELKELINSPNSNNMRTYNKNSERNSNNQNYKETNNNNNIQKRKSSSSEIEEFVIKQEGKLINDKNKENLDNLTKLSTNSIDVKSTNTINYPTNRMSFLTSRIGFISSQEKLFYKYNNPHNNNIINNDTRPSTSSSNKTIQKSFSEYKNETENKKINDLKIEKIINLDSDDNTNYFKKKYMNRININKINLNNNNNNNDISKSNEKEDLLKHNNNPLSLNILNNNTLKSNFNNNLNRNYRNSDRSLINNINFRKSPLKLLNNNQNNNNNNENNSIIDENNIEPEDLIVLEEKLLQIYESFENGKPLFILCIEWWNFYIYCNSGYKIDNLFYNEKDYNIIHESAMLELLSIIILYEILMNIKYSNSDLNIMKNLLFEVFQNFLIICDYILNTINFDVDKKIHVNELQNKIFSKLEHKIKNNDHIHLLKTNNSNINNKLKIILKLFSNNEKISTVNFYYKKLVKISLKTLNDYFRRKISSDCIKTGDVLTFNNSLQQTNLNENIPYLNFPINSEKTFTLVLDLDETLINYRIDEIGRGVLRPRPHLNKFLKELNKVYELIIFTAGTQDYADPILNVIEKKHKFFEKRLYRQHCIILDNIFVKDLSKLGRDLNKIIIVDNMKQNFKLQKENGIFIKNFYGDKNDSTLVELLPILLEIAKNKENDVKIELKKFKNEIFTKITTNLKNEDNFLS